MASKGLLTSKRAIPSKRVNKETHTFFHKLFFQLGYKCMDDWYKVTHADIYKNGGGALLQRYYNSSPSSALKSVYPEHNWKLWRFHSKPKGYWNNEANHKQFFEWSKAQLGYKCMDDWYKVTREDIDKNGGGGLLSNIHNSSPSLVLKSVYPEHNWELWRFKRVPKGYLERMAKDHNEIKRMMEWLSGQLSIKCLDDRYRISLGQACEFVAIGSAKELATMLQTAYPQHQWDKSLLHRIGFQIKASQRELMLAVQRLFPTQSTFIFHLTVAYLKQYFLLSGTNTVQGWRKTTNTQR